ncbi:hypothetical protein GGS20DRAFT_586912 [Poronia punctata]|nr:hypothetical protein GGS20DRAFT_586912 [Poronia punctata]
MAIDSALFNFQSLLLVILLLICTSAYVHSLFPTILDRNKQGCVPRPKTLGKGRTGRRQYGYLLTNAGALG